MPVPEPTGIDGVVLTSAAHPLSSPLRPWRPPFLRWESLETIEIEVPQAIPPEVRFVYDSISRGGEFNEAFNSGRLSQLARERFEERQARKLVRRRRYQRWAERQANYRYCHPSKLIVTREEIADNLYAAGL